MAANGVINKFKSLLKLEVADDDEDGMRVYVQKHLLYIFMGFQNNPIILKKGCKKQ